MRLSADAAHQFGGIALDRSRPLSFRLDGRRVTGFAGDTVLTALLAAGIDTYGTLDGQPIGLTISFAPLIRFGRGEPLPMDRTPAVDGADIATVGRRLKSGFRPTPSLRHVLDAPTDAPWLRARADETRDVDLLVIGGGVAGLAAADAAAAEGRSVLIVERRPWFGGDAQYFGAVGDDETPEALVARLLRQLDERTVELLGAADAFSLAGTTALLHAVVPGTPPSGRVIAVTARDIVLATGAQQRLPIFPGNRQPGVLPAIEAYHLAKRYGVVRGDSAVVATQSNYGYRLALRLHDAGVAIRRVVDTRIHPQSRFVDFAKAGGLTLASGQMPIAAEGSRFSFAPVTGGGASAAYEATALIVSGTWQPELGLWMQAGGQVRWSTERMALMAHGHLEHLALAGAANGTRSMRACVASGRAAWARLAGAEAEAIVDTEAGTDFEAADAGTPAAPAGTSAAFLGWGSSLAARPDPGRGDSTRRAHALSLADVAALVELSVVAPSDAGAIAEERGAPGSDLQASDWRPPMVPPPAPDSLPPYLIGRFGDDPVRLHLIVDRKTRFDIGMLVYLPGGTRLPHAAIGAIVEAAETGGIALVARQHAAAGRYVIQSEAGPMPARISPA